jgi:hypothetical protein
VPVWIRTAEEQAAHARRVLDRRGGRRRAAVSVAHTLADVAATHTGLTRGELVRRAVESGHAGHAARAALEVALAHGDLHAHPGERRAQHVYPGVDCADCGPRRGRTA